MTLFWADGRWRIYDLLAQGVRGWLYRRELQSPSPARKDRRRGNCASNLVGHSSSCDFCSARGTYTCESDRIFLSFDLCASGKNISKYTSKSRWFYV